MEFPSQQIISKEIYKYDVRQKNALKKNKEEKELESDGKTLFQERFLSKEVTLMQSSERTGVSWGNIEETNF